jgi:F-type H+-transporting ATPase subunit delta
MTPRGSARRYARALFDVARAEGVDFDTVASDLSDVAGTVAGHAQLQRVFGNPAIPAARKRGIVEQLLARTTVTPIVARTLLLLAARDRLVLLPDLAEAYRARLMDHRNTVRAELTTALPLPPERAAALQQGLAQVTGRDVLLDVKVDPSILGGAVARVGSTVYDGSVTTQLEKLKQQLVTAQMA